MYIPPLGLVSSHIQLYSHCGVFTGKKDVPPSAVTRPICGVMGTIRLVAGSYHGERALYCQCSVENVFEASDQLLTPHRDVPDRHHQEEERRQPPGTCCVEGCGF